MKEAVNNFYQVAKLLTWEKPGDYYYVQLILRKKDGATTFANKNNSARLIKTYQFFNLEQFLAKEIEIIELCELCKCRAGINLNVRNEEAVAYKLLTNLAERISSRNFKGINGILNTTNGGVKSDDRIWLIDCDSEDEYYAVRNVLSDETLRPLEHKILAVLPTYTGKHIITRTFDRETFDKNLHIHGVAVDIHKNNPAALYYPSKN